MATIYSQLEVDFVRDPKMRRAGPLARLLYIQTMCWGKENETDGKVEPVFAAEVAADIPQYRKHFRKLVEVGLMEEMPDGGWRIPLEVWIKRNPTKQDLDAMRRKKSEAGKRGAHSKWHDAENAHDWCDACHEAGYLVERVEPIEDDDDKPMAGAMADAKQVDGESIARTSDLKPQPSNLTSSRSGEMTQQGPVYKSGPTDPFIDEVLEQATDLVIADHPSRFPNDPRRRNNHRERIKADIATTNLKSISDALRATPNASSRSLANEAARRHG